MTPHHVAAGTSQPLAQTRPKFRRRPPDAAEQKRRVEWGKRYGAIGRQIGEAIRAGDA